MVSFFDEKIKALREERDKKRLPYDDEYLDVAGGIGSPPIYRVGENLLVYKDELLGKDNIKGDYVVGKTEMDQVSVINPDCLPGQAEIIYLVFLYRLVKWHFVPLKADEWMELNPIHTPPFFTALAAKEKLEQHIKQGLSQVTQATADYELFKNDLRKYDEILSYFYESKKEGKEHVLRSLFVDRVDAHTGEGYSMISMARRWPTIITDFIRLKTEDAEDLEKLQKSLNISLAEATVLKTKDRIYEHWKKYFFDDIKERYARIKNLMEAQEKQLNEYANWLKPYVNKYKRIKEISEVKTHFKLNEAQVFSYTPFSGLRARLWFYRGFTPEEMGKPFEEVENPVDDFVLRWARKFEEKYGVSFVRDLLKPEEIENDDEYDYDNLRKAIEKYFAIVSKAEDYTHEIVKYVTVIDKRYKYFAFFDIYYEADYMKGSQGPLEMEDIYYHIFPYIVSINVLLVLHLELYAKELRFQRYIEKLIGTKNAEKELEKEIDDIFKEAEKEEKKRKGEKIKKEKEKKKKNLLLHQRLRKRYIKWRIEKLPKYDKLILRYLRKKGPYERLNKERFSKEYATPLGKDTKYIYDLLKQTCFKLSGVYP